MQLSNAKEVIYVDIDDTKHYGDIFKLEEKERASRIEEALRGMTINEAQEFLEKVSDALTRIRNI